MFAAFYRKAYYFLPRDGVILEDDGTTGQDDGTVIICT